VVCPQEIWCWVNFAVLRTTCPQTDLPLSSVMKTSTPLLSASEGTSPFFSPPDRLLLRHTVPRRMNLSARADYIRQPGPSSQLIDQQRFRGYQRRDRGLFGHGRKIAQKLVKCMPAFPLVQQRLKWNAGASETGVPPRIPILDQDVHRSHLLLQSLSQSHRALR